MNTTRTIIINYYVKDYLKLITEHIANLKLILLFRATMKQHFLSCQSVFENELLEP